VSGTSLGIPLPGGYETLPLNWDWFTDAVLVWKNTPVFESFLGKLQPDGTAEASFVFPGYAGVAGAVLYFAYCLNNPFDVVSNPVEIGYLGASSNNAGQRYWSLSMNGTVTRGPAALTVGTTSLLVAKLSWASGSFTVDLYVDPAALGGAAPASPTVSATLAAFDPFESIGIHSSGTNEASFDELRIGTSFAAVTPTESVNVSPWRPSLRQALAEPQVRQSGGAVTVAGLAAGGRVELLTLTGRVAARALAGSTPVVLRSSRSGTYLLRVISAGAVTVEQVVVP